MKKALSLFLAGLMVASLAACGNNAESQPATDENKTVADQSEMAAPQEIEEGTPVYADVLNDGTYDITVESSSSMFNIEACQLTVADGKMTAAMTMGGTGYLYVFPGTGEEAAAVQSQIEDIRQAGFAIDSFGENSFAVRSVPAYLDSGDVQSVISELAEKAMNSRTTVPDRLDDLIHTVACKAAIKAGKPTTMTELQDLCERVLSDDNVRSCPHGRPTTVRLTKYELDKMFKRVNQ